MEKTTIIPQSPDCAFYCWDRRVHPNDIKDVASDVLNNRKTISEALVEHNLKSEDTEGVPSGRNISNWLRFHSGRKEKPNIYQEVSDVLDLFYDETNDFLKEPVFVAKDEPPVLILYHDEMVEYARAVLTSHPGSIIGVDRTFSLSTAYLTVCTLQIHNLLHRITRKNPVVGLMYSIQHRATVAHYRPLFRHMNEKLIQSAEVYLKPSEPSDKISQHAVKVGADGEVAIAVSAKKEIKHVKIINCTTHLDKQLSRNLKQCSIEPERRHYIQDTMFSKTHGILHISNSMQHFDSNLQSLQAEFEGNKKVEKLIISIGSQLRDYVLMPHLLEDTPLDFSTNFVESFNHVIKKYLSWRCLPVFCQKNCKG